MKHGAETKRIHIKLHVEGSAVGVSGCAEACDLPQEGSAGGPADTNAREHRSCCSVIKIFHDFQCHTGMAEGHWAFPAQGQWLLQLKRMLETKELRTGGRTQCALHPTKEARPWKHCTVCHLIKHCKKLVQKRKGEREGKVTGGTKQEQSTAIQSWPLQHWNEQPAPSSAGSTVTLLLDGSRQLSLASPRFSAQAEMNIQELERHPHPWCRGCGQALPEQPLVRRPVRLQGPSCPPCCRAAVCPRPLPGRRPRPSCSRARVSRAPAQRPSGAGTQWDFSLIGCLEEGWAGQGLSRAWPRREGWQLGQPQQSCAF